MGVVVGWGGKGLNGLCFSVLRGNCSALKRGLCPLPYPTSARAQSPHPWIKSSSPLPSGMPAGQLIPGPGHRHGEGMEVWDGMENWDGV